MQHLEEGTIHAWLDGELSAAEQAQAERHVAECADCAAAVAEARGMIAGASRIVSALDVVRGAGGGGVLPRQSAKPAGPRSVWHSLRFTPTRAALAASLLVAAGALFTVNHATSNRMAPFADAVSAPQMAAPKSAGPVPASGAMASPAPTIASAMDSSAPRASVKSVTRQAAQPAARTVPARGLAEAKHADSVLQRLPAANAVAVAPASDLAAAQKAAAAPPSAPAPNARTPISVAPGATGAAGAVASERRFEQARMVDSLAARSIPDTVRAATDSRRALQSTQSRLENVVTSGAFAATRFDLTGCYQIKPDSSALLHLLPNRFALERTTGAADSNVVRAVTPDGRKDSVVTGSNWVQISNDKAQIQSTFGNQHQVVLLQLTSLGGVSGKALTANGTRPISVARATCRP